MFVVDGLRRKNKPYISQKYMRYAYIFHCIPKKKKIPEDCNCIEPEMEEYKKNQKSYFFPLFIHFVGS
jgi:hypothetical protein